MYRYSDIFCECLTHIYRDEICYLKLHCSCAPILCNFFVASLCKNITWNSKVSFEAQLQFLKNCAHISEYVYVVCLYGNFDSWITQIRPMKFCAQNVKCMPTSSSKIRIDSSTVKKVMSIERWEKHFASVSFSSYIYRIPERQIFLFFLKDLHGRWG